MTKQSKELKVVVGIGKTGFSCLRYLHNEGYAVAAVDSREAPPNLEILQKEFPDVPVHVGNFAAPFLLEAEELIVSPGVALKTPEIAQAIEHGVKAAGDIELFCRDAKAPIIAITGSNGKSTVTTLVGEMAKAAGVNVLVGGNLGTPALDLLALPTPELYVLELSSFQLETTGSLKTKAAVLLNISEDHLDRYDNMEHYTKTKQHIYDNAECSVINREDKVSFAGVDFSDNNKVVSFGLDKPPSANDFGIIDNHLALGDKKLMPINELKIKGLHQAANALASLALGKAFGLPMEAMLEALHTFAGLTHRCEYVATIKGVSFYNDSKGTNVGSTKAAITGIGGTIDGKILLIAGGLGKGADFTPLQDGIAKYGRLVILIGRDGPIIEKALKDHCQCVYADSLDSAIDIAQKEAKEGDAVLLSPACASFDMFNNFEHRGHEFRRMVGERIVY